MARIYNFSAGPSTLPESCLQEAAEEMLDYRGCGMSVMEMSHRSKMFQGIFDEAEADIRDLMGIPANYKVLFLQGGAWTQFAAIPMNMMRTGKADYIVTGNWSKNAAKEAKRFGDARVVASSEDKTFSYVPDVDAIQFNADADYVYICDNETVYGNKYKKYPTTGDVPLFADVSSCFLSEPMNVTDFGLIYGGAQKNVGPAGLTIVIVREDLIPTEDLPTVPSMLQYRIQADKGSMFNTPPCYAIYMAGKTFKWLKSLGGLEAMKARNEAKAKLLYDFLDQSQLFKANIRPCDRSLMNVTFVTGDADLDAKFVAEAKANGMENLKGHRSVGGMRASIYNAMPIEGVETLVKFMGEFEKENL